VKPPVTTRLFEAPDLRALYAIEEACFDPPIRFSRSLMRSLAFSSECRTWVAILNDIRIGFAMVGIGTEQDPNLAYIWTIEVLPAFRRMGAARALLHQLEVSAAASGCQEIELHVSERNADGVALYVATGYERIGLEPEYYGHDENAFRYRKILRSPITQDRETPSK
jgi:ribosomal protein S18 acetylase RimI-like enzyme